MFKIGKGGIGAVFTAKFIKRGFSKFKKLILPKQNALVRSVWDWEHYRNGKLIDSWTDTNLCTDEGLNDLLDVMFSAGTQKTSWYIALFSDDYTPLATNTYATPGYTESTEYDEANRPTWQDGGVAGKQVSNSGNKASFTMTGTDTAIYGSSLVSDSTKGDTAASGAKLYALAQFGAAKTGIEDGDVLKVTATLTASDV